MTRAPLLPPAPHRAFRTVGHPDGGAVRMDQLAALYAWHGRHHVAHVPRLRERMGG